MMEVVRKCVRMLNLQSPHRSSPRGKLDQASITTRCVLVALPKNEIFSRIKAKT